jgi:GNAT superfamily N-acetyltransferase
MLKLINDANFASKEYEAFKQMYDDPKNNSWMFSPYDRKGDFWPIFQMYVKAGEVFLYVNEKAEYVGICRLTTTEKGPYQCVATINSLAISSNHHRQGYGKQILDALKEYTREKYRHVLRLELAYEGDNPVAIVGDFYDKNGFQCEGFCLDWFGSRAIHFKETRFPWYTTEYFACYFYEDKMKEINLKKGVLQATSNSFLEKNELSFRFANIGDTEAITRLYENSLTSWAHEALENRSQLIGESINTKKVFLVSTGHTIVAACEIDESPKGIEHTAIIQNLLILDHEPTTAAFLVENVVEHYKKLKSNIKRLELNTIAEDKSLIHSVEISGFKCAAKFPARFCDVHGSFWDEHIFEYSLFGLQDALNCCTQRKKSEFNLTSGIEKFYVPLPLGFLAQLEEKLTGIQSSEPLTFVEEQLIYQLVRVVCTQDCYSLESRHKNYLQLQSSFATTFAASKALEEIYMMGIGQLTQKLDSNVGLLHPIMQHTILQEQNVVLPPSDFSLTHN